MTLPITPAQVTALLALRAHAPDLRFVVIGAAAAGHYVSLDRATSDVDLAIVIAPHQLDALLEPLGWTRDPRILQRWHGPDGFKADVLPATPDLIEAGRVFLDGDMRVMSLIGFDLGLEHAEDVPIHGSTQAVQVASLPSLVVLKMVAWLERSHQRLKDLGDLATIFEQALSADDDCRWDPTHPVGAAELNYEQQSPFFVGLSVAQIAGPSHQAKIHQFLQAMRDERRSWCAVMAREAGYAGEDPEGRVADRGEE